jgi:uncharacterized protein (TIGR02246 family)
MTGGDDATFRLELLEAAEAARSLFAQYATAVDARDVVATMALFAADAELVRPGEVFSGHDSIAAFYTNAFARAPLRRHFVTNIWLSRNDGIMLDVEAYFLFLDPPEHERLGGHGRYSATVRIGEGSGRFARLRIERA